MNKSTSWFSLLKLYFSVISIVGVLGTAIAFGIVGYSRINQLFISDAEYIAWNSSREIQQCEDPSFFPIVKPVMLDGEKNTNKIKKKTQTR